MMMQYVRTYIPCRCFRPRYAVFNGVLNSWDMYLMYDLLESRRAFLKPIDICSEWDKVDFIHKNMFIVLTNCCFFLGMSIILKCSRKKTRVICLIIQECYHRRSLLHDRLCMMTNTIYHNIFSDQRASQWVSKWVIESVWHPVSQWANR